MTIKEMLETLDPTHAFSDDHRYWTRHNELMKDLARELSKIPYEEALAILQAKYGTKVIYRPEQHEGGRHFYFDWLI